MHSLYYRVNKGDMNCNVNRYIYCVHKLYKPGILMQHIYACDSFIHFDRYNAINMNV